MLCYYQPSPSLHYLSPMFKPNLHMKDASKRKWDNIPKPFKNLSVSLPNLIQTSSINRLLSQHTRGTFRESIESFWAEKKSILCILYSFTKSLCSFKKNNFTFIQNRNPQSIIPSYKLSHKPNTLSHRDCSNTRTVSVVPLSSPSKYK